MAMLLLLVLIVVGLGILSAVVAFLSDILPDLIHPIKAKERRKQSEREWKGFDYNTAMIIDDKIFGYTDDGFKEFPLVDELSEKVA